MSAKSEEAVYHLLNDVLDFARGRMSESQFVIVEPFLKHYYDFADVDELQSRSIADLYGAAMAHWYIAQRFVPGSERLVVHNVILEQDHWESDHTVVEIVIDDSPFLVDSIAMAVNSYGLAVHSISQPVFRVWRGSDGSIVRLAQAQADDIASDSLAHLVSFIRFEVDRCSDAAKISDLRDEISRALGDVRAAVEDWPLMDERLRATIGNPAAYETGDEGDEAKAFLEWVRADHYTFLGQRDYELVFQDGRFGLRGLPDSGLGILRESTHGTDTPAFKPLSAAAEQVLRGKCPVFLTKENSRATVHRPDYLDYVGVKLSGPDGNIFGERRFVGLYTARAYSMPISRIPLVRRKVANIGRRVSSFGSAHLHHSVLTVLEQYPREELFMAGEDELLDSALGIVRLQDHPRIGIFARHDPFDRFVTCLVFVPRRTFNTNFRRRIATALMDAFMGDSLQFTSLLSDSQLTRIQFTLRGQTHKLKSIDLRQLETRLASEIDVFDELLIDVLKGEGVHAHHALSPFSSDGIASWLSLEAAMADQSPVAGQVKLKVKEGFTVVVAGLCALLPFEFIDENWINNESLLRNDTFKFWVAELNRESGRIVISNHKMAESSTDHQARLIYQIGAAIKGTVDKISESGVSLRLSQGGRGVIRSSDLSWNGMYDRHLRIYSEGDEVEAMVLGFQDENVLLGIKQLDERTDDREFYQSLTAQEMSARQYPIPISTKDQSIKKNAKYKFGTMINILHPRIEKSVVRELLIENDSFYADYLCTTGVEVCLTTSPCSSLDHFIDQITSISEIQVDISWPVEDRTYRLHQTLGVLVIFPSGAIRGIGHPVQVTRTGLTVKIESGLDLLDPDAEDNESAFEDTLECRAILFGVEEI